MSAPRSLYGQILDDLLTRLTQIADEAVHPNLRGFHVFLEMASTPKLWPLDDVLFEMLLTSAGFDLNDADHLRGAHFTTALLVAGDPSYDGLVCGHDDTPSTFCQYLDDVDLHPLYQVVMDMAKLGTFDTAYEARRQRCEHYGIDDTGPDDLSDAA